MGNPVCDYTGLAATGAGQYQQGTFDVLHSLSLAGIQTFQEIHESTVLSGGSCEDPQF